MFNFFKKEKPLEKVSSKEEKDSSKEEEAKKEEKPLEEGNESLSTQKDKEENLEGKASPKEEESREEPEKVEKKEEESKPFPKKSVEELEKETKKEIIEVFKNVEDPELGIDIWSLGLIYDIKGKEELDITMTFTSPMCPYGPQIVNDMQTKLKEKKYESKVEVVFNPLWEPSKELKEALGLG